MEQDKIYKEISSPFTVIGSQLTVEKYSKI
ncbi:hypothetical protein BuS5_00537 [Desulfosarcina sp. BuS5]|nr:hypothetical protein BuS5_00537 [Desulfosarcina sp. BuS5]